MHVFAKQCREANGLINLPLRNTSSDIYLPGTVTLNICLLTKNDNDLELPITSNVCGVYFEGYLEFNNADT